MMFNDAFYVKFNTKGSYVVYDDNVSLYGKELQKALKRHYPNMTEDERRMAFKEDLDISFRDYAKVCHIKIIYDYFTHNMKEYLKNTNSLYALCEIQKMTRKEIFYMFYGAPISLLYEVASNIFSYVEEEKDSHDE